LANVSGSLSSDISLFELSRIYEDATTIYEAGQLEVDSLSLGSYTEMLADYKVAYQGVITRLQNALNFEDAANQRLSEAKVQSPFYN